MTVAQTKIFGLNPANSASFSEEGPEKRESAKSGNFPDTQRRRIARTPGAVFQATLDGRARGREGCRGGRLALQTITGA